MTQQPFDRFVRRAAVVRDRRSALAILSGALLATARAPRGAFATLPGDKPDGPKGKNDCKDKKDKKKAKKTSKRCQTLAGTICLQNLDVFTAAACAVELEACCAFYGACLDKHAGQCTRKVEAKYHLI